MDLTQVTYLFSLFFKFCLLLKVNDLIAHDEESELEKYPIDLSAGENRSLFFLFVLDSRIFLTKDLWFIDVFDLLLVKDFELRCKWSFGVNKHHCS
ncbi:hypothetical protein BpHYR1_019489 [Brachionus plicatilis]|uniref:Uncharacterized protein n=1 Tax=Brachionus plicatilis TaxID=10195 RepID=A0A3M7RBV8_BRAPC|nr:hypothetical protein BpHYR1_019489 [Brachionus plicatilis]